MATKVLFSRIGTALLFTTNDPVLALGETGYEQDTGRLKVGDGVTAWTSLPYKFEGVTDHGALTGLLDDDHTQYLTEARHDSLPFDNPHNVDATDVGLGNVDNTSDLDKPISTATQTALNLKYDASNPANYIDSAGAPVQPVDIANFETTTQLNVRDTNNRNRANHTGTQLASTISDFAAQVAIDETTTTLVEAPAGTFTYTNEDGATTVFVIAAGGTTPWIVNGSDVHYPDGNVGVAVDNPIHNIQVGEQFNDTPGPARVQNTEIAQYSGTATNNGTAQLGLYESVPSGFPGDYGARIRYDATTNLLIFATVAGGVETEAFNFDRTTQTATYNGIIDAGSNQGKNFANPTDAQDVMTLLYWQQRTDAVKVRNTATGNLNTGVATFNNFTTTDELGSTLGQFTFATNGITPNFTGSAEVTFTVELNGAATRATVGFRWAHNGSFGPWVRPTYIRNSSGHTESSATITTKIPVVSGQPIQIQHDNFAGGGTVTSSANGVEFIVQRFR